MMASIHLLVDTSTQCMSVFDGDGVIHVFEISTAKNGTGQLENTGCTPLGHHQIAPKMLSLSDGYSQGKSMMSSWDLAILIETGF